MSSLEELKRVRREKLAKIKSGGLNPYPAVSKRAFSNADATADFSAISASGKAVTLSGRILALRPQGALIFVSFSDGTATFQALLKKGDTPAGALSLFSEVADIGDFADFTGALFETKRGEKTILVSSWAMLGKSLLPLPEKWHGLEDQEEKLRKRYLDLLFAPELKAIFLRKQKFWDVTREFLKDDGFLEVETPTLEFTTGGAEARPFKTHHHDFDMDLYLRISVGELWQKRLMAAGFPKTFEIGRVYRNEGTSAEHLQEFTNVEFYSAYWSNIEGMAFVKELYQTIAKKVYGRTKFGVKDSEFDLAGDWPLVDYADEVRRQTGLDVFSDSDQKIRNKLDELKVSYKGENRERLIDTLWKYCRKNIAGPAFLVGHPVIVSPLAKLDPKDQRKTLMFQPLIAGSEVGRGYAELNDPAEQRARFEEQKKFLEAGDEEAMMPDFEFVEMLEHGMPPTCGFGFGERLFALLENRPIREVTLFPLVRPKI
ncbi:MAG: lysyl-tRNA synthetase [Parcubacteria group bacterium GW2011_GWA2_47_21]|nr:MAG: lysyl-tRNA synthetase [Parcubacteria group bacterium GW2011_GWA2_47_21]